MIESVCGREVFTHVPAEGVPLIYQRREGKRQIVTEIELITLKSLQGHFYCKLKSASRH